MPEKKRDIGDRLHEMRPVLEDFSPELLIEAADEIERLRARQVHLEKALAPFATVGEFIDVEMSGVDDGRELKLIFGSYSVARLTLRAFRRASLALNPERTGD